MSILDNYSQLHFAKMEQGIVEDYSCEVVPSFIKFCKLKNAINDLTLKDTEKLKVKFKNSKNKSGKRYISDYLEIPFSQVTQNSDLEYRKLTLKALLTDKEFAGEEIIKAFRSLEEENNAIKALNCLLKK